MYTNARQQFLHVTETALQDRQAVTETGSHFVAGGGGIGIAVNPPHGAVGGFQKRTRVPAGTEGRIHVNGPVAGRQNIRHFMQQNRDMPFRHGSWQRHWDGAT